MSSSVTKKPIVFISNFHPFVTRNILDAGVLDLLLEKSQVVMFVLKSKENYFRENYQHHSLTVEGVDLKAFIHNKKNKLFQKISELLLDTKVKKFHKMAYQERTKKHFRYYLMILFTKTFSHFKLFKDLFRYLDLKLNNPNSFDQYFSKYRPDIVFATDVYDENDVLLLKNAKSRDVENIGMIRSWDNTTTKNYMRTAPSRLMVHNEVMKDECRKLHDISSDKILLTGVTQFDHYLTLKPSTRGEFYEKMGLNPDKRVILICPAGEVFIDTDWQTCEILKQLYREKVIPQDVQFLVSLHPYNFSDFSRFIPDENFVIKNWVVDDVTQRAKERELPKNFRQEFADVLYHSSLVLNVVSSTLIDASIFDKPVITIGFNGWEKSVPFLRSVERFQLEENLAVWLDQGVSPIARNKEELGFWINKYLKDPNFEKEKRKEFVEQYCWRFDGKSKERIADYVLNS